jgi:hypothetical protein
MQLPEKYKENFDVSSEGPSSGVTSGGPCLRLTGASELGNLSCKLSLISSGLTRTYLEYSENGCH